MKTKTEVSALQKQFVLNSPYTSVPKKFQKYIDKHSHKQLKLIKIIMNPETNKTEKQTIVLRHKNRLYYFDHPELRSRIEDEDTKILLDYINLIHLPGDIEVGIGQKQLDTLLTDFDFFFYMEDQLFLFTEEDIRLYRNIRGRGWVKNN